MRLLLAFGCFRKILKKFFTHILFRVIFLICTMIIWLRFRLLPRFCIALWRLFSGKSTRRNSRNLILFLRILLRIKSVSKTGVMLILSYFFRPLIRKNFLQKIEIMRQIFFKNLKILNIFFKKFFKKIFIFRLHA